VVTSSVATAGVLLVFSLLIVPAVIGFTFSDKLSVVLLIAWSAGIAACAVGLASSYAFDLPTGAAMVTALAGLLVLASLVKPFVGVDAKRRNARLRKATESAVVAGFVCILVSSLWLIANPAGDQPLLSLFERATGFDSATFLSSSERDLYESAARDIVRFQGEVDRLDTMEKTARYQGLPLGDDEIRRIASYQQSFNEMTRGERFVRDVLQTKARTRERWIIGLPSAILALVGLGLSLHWFRSRTPFRPGSGR
jgi:zinc/manganese transport system permease protein